MPHALTTHQVHVQMVNDLPSVWTGVDYQAVAILLDTFSFGKLFSDREKLPHERLIFVVDLVDRCDVLVRHDQDVRRGNRMDVEKSGYSLVFVNDGGGRLSISNFAEDAIRHVEFLVWDFANYNNGKREKEKRSELSSDLVPH
jgi:hypothetical protein